MRSEAYFGNAESVGLGKSLSQQGTCMYEVEWSSTIQEDANFGQTDASENPCLGC